MTLVLIRHAQKGIVPFEDPELTPQGFQQAQALYNLIVHKTLPQPTHLWCSKKIRTRQTLEAISENLSLNIEEKIEFNIRQDQESLLQFRDRIQNSIHKSAEFIQKNNSTLYICTHFDWIEESMSIFKCDKNLLSPELSHWAPAQFLVLNYDSQSHQWIYKKTGAAR